MSQNYSLSQMGWSSFFQQQISLEQWEHSTLGRVIECHRSHIEIMTEQSISHSLPVNSRMPDLTVGDWLLMSSENQFEVRLERFSLFERKSAGSKVALQLIAANVNTVFIVCSLNNNFNLNRIERYLALARQAEVEPVVVLTKLDCCIEPQDYVKQVQSLDPMLVVEAVNALETKSVKVLRPWCAQGQTVAFLGSSGVGKSTLVNTLLNQNRQETASSREEDSRGRHTTTKRSLHFMAEGGLLIDTPGMRELQLTDCEKGIEDTFSEIYELAVLCQFSNCQHQSEPGCAVLAAIDSGKLELRRLINYGKLLAEQSRNATSLAETRSKERSLGRFYRSVQAESKQRKNKLM
ncbi:ribosome small subunit-dependent GTPase A [Pseudoalteromonas denitrificans]|uniref:Small ribosomal subunit biogenesis GTPase RsgA n=1 Tax=Pseudoalteromonas denitrificans DSM 6059 TaxID=1123010 RepID=A0A1I1SFS5_9GAMM|nr:ribosome small subunit-dependent GTPase A [Pseudoalteromonas denitrificans]SFD45344.1 ribosome biogenesis GTPase [Pseudoalteromonas denitrificans DSM 6059]